MSSASPVKYSLNFTNNSKNNFVFCLFQQAPDASIPNLFPLAWFTQQVDAGSQCIFDWEINFDFVWSETGTLKPGVIFTASQIVKGDLSTSNKITLLYDGAYTFSPVGAGPRQGSLFIAEDGSIPGDTKAAVGIGMSGNGTFAVQAQANLNLTFTPHPEYWVAFGQFEPGEVLDIQELSNIAEVKFPDGVYSMAASINGQNQWTISTLAASNANRIARKAYAR